MKKRFPKNGNLLETTRNREISSFPVVSFFGKPLCCFNQLFTARNSRLDDSAYMPCIGNLGKPHKVCPRVSTPGNSQPNNSTSFPCIGNFGETSRGFPRVSTRVNSQLQDSTKIPCMENSWITTSLLFFHMLPRCFQNVIFKVIITCTFKVMKMTIELKKASPFHSCMSLHKDV